jgi:hypothetical protein
MLKSVEAHFREGRKVLRAIEETLGPDDVVHIKLENAMTAYANALNQIAAIVEKGEIIEDFDVEGLKARG